MVTLLHRSRRSALVLAVPIATVTALVGTSLDDELSSTSPNGTEILIAETDNGGG